MKEQMVSCPAVRFESFRMPSGVVRPIDVICQGALISVLLVPYVGWCEAFTDSIESSFAPELFQGLGKLEIRIFRCLLSGSGVREAAAKLRLEEDRVLAALLGGEKEGMIAKNRWCLLWVRAYLFVVRAQARMSFQGAYGQADSRAV